MSASRSNERAPVPVRQPAAPPMHHVSPAQSRAARAFLQWSQAELEKKTGVCIRTIRNFEGEVRQPHEHTMAAICNAFETHGVEFLPQDSGGEGVQFKKAHPMVDDRKGGRCHGRSTLSTIAR